jgi:hypothetical protein
VVGPLGQDTEAAPRLAEPENKQEVVPVQIPHLHIMETRVPDRPAVLVIVTHITVRVSSLVVVL